MKRYEIKVKVVGELNLTIKGLEEWFSVSTGNKKLKSTKKVLFLIWNLPAVFTCPFVTEHCIDKCYARKAERAYPNCFGSRYRNLMFSLSEMFVPMMINYIENKLKGLPEGRKIIFRIHESGDFYSREYAKKWAEISNHFADDDRITFTAYTKSHIFFYGLNHNINLNFSLWDDTEEEDLALAKEMSLPIYTAEDTFADADRKYDNYFKCRCADCGTCQACYHGKVKLIVCEIH